MPFGLETSAWPVMPHFFLIPVHVPSSHTFLFPFQHPFSEVHGYLLPNSKTITTAKWRVSPLPVCPFYKSFSAWGLVKSLTFTVGVSSQLFIIFLALKTGPDTLTDCASLDSEPEKVSGPSVTSWPKLGPPNNLSQVFKNGQRHHSHDLLADVMFNDCLILMTVIFNDEKLH